MGEEENRIWKFLILGIDFLGGRSVCSPLCQSAHIKILVPHRNSLGIQNKCYNRFHKGTAIYYLFNGFNIRKKSQPLSIGCFYLKIRRYLDLAQRDIPYRSKFVNIMFSRERTGE